MEKKTGGVKVCGNCARKFEAENDFLYHSSRWRRCSAGYLWFNCECDSTLILLEGDPPWFRPDMSMSPNAASVYRRFGSFDRVPKMPTAVFQFQAALDDERASAASLAKAAKQTPFIAASVLSTANAMRAGSGAKIIGLEHAIAYVGRDVLKTLAVVAAAKTFDLPTKVFSSRVFWHDSLVAAGVAERLVKLYAKDLDSDEIYVAASLANVGKAVMAMLLPDAVDGIMLQQEAPETSKNWSSMERDIAHTSHTTIGEIAAALWGLPEYVREGIIGHHNLSNVLVTSKEEPAPLDAIDMVASAIQLSHFVLLRPLQVQAPIVERFRKRFVAADAAWDQLLESLYPISQATTRLLNEMG